MVAAAYVAERACILILLIVLFLTSLFQIFVSKFILRSKDAKHYIHYWIAATAFFLLLASIDAGIFGVYHHLLTWLILKDLGTNSVMGCLCVVIIAHFRAHYLSLKKDMPSYFSTCIILPIIIGFFISPLGHILAIQSNSVRYLPLLWVNAVFELGVVTGLDWWGYLNIRRMLIDVIRIEYPHYRASWCCGARQTRRITKSSQQRTESVTDRSARGDGGGGKGGGSAGGGQVDYEGLLNKLCKLHVMALSTTIIWLCVFTIQTIPQFQDPDMVPNIAPDPNAYSFNTEVCLSLAGAWLMAWWGWVPWSVIQEKWQSSQSTGNSSQTTRGVSVEKEVVTPRTRENTGEKETETDRLGNSEVGLIQGRNDLGSSSISHHGLEISLSQQPEPHSPRDYDKFIPSLPDQTAFLYPSSSSSSSSASSSTPSSPKTDLSLPPFESLRNNDIQPSPSSPSVTPTKQKGEEEKDRNGEVELESIDEDYTVV